MTQISPVPRALLEAALYVDDLDAAESFYGTLLGLERLQRVSDRHVFYRVGGAVLLIFNPARTSQPSDNPALPVPTHGTQGPGHLCFAMDRNEIEALRQRLETSGVSTEAAFDWPNGARSLYVRDPAGNSIEFAEPRLWNL